MCRLGRGDRLPHLDEGVGRVRLAGDDEEFGLDQIAVDFHGLPQLDADASPEQVQSFVTGFFEALESASAQSPTQFNLEPALAA